MSRLIAILFLPLVVACSVGRPIPGGPAPEPTTWKQYNDNDGPCHDAHACESPSLCVGWNRDPYVTKCTTACDVDDDCDGECVDGRCMYPCETDDDCSAYNMASEGFEFLCGAAGDPGTPTICGWHETEDNEPAV